MRFFCFLALAAAVCPLLAAAFVAVANQPFVPPYITPLLLHGFFPAYLFATAVLYGCSSLRPGGSVFLAAALLAALWYGAVQFYLPFSSALTNPVFLTVAFLTVIGGEICGKTLKRRWEKQRKGRSQSSAPNHQESFRV